MSATTRTQRIARLVLSSASFPGSTVQTPVYHGTDKKFDEFSYQKSKRFVLFSEFEVETRGFFFSESPHDALEYGRNIVECYINLQNPLLDPRRDRHLGIDRLPYKREMDLLKILGAAVGRDQHGPYIDLGVQRHWINPKRDEFAHQWIYNAVGTDGLDWDVIDNPNVIQRMRALGYDGTFVQEPESSLGRSIVVFSPDQVRMVRWVNGPQREWGQKDDYEIRKNTEGAGMLHANPTPYFPEEDDDDEWES